MPVVRNRLSSVVSGGPRQFTELRNEFIARVEPDSSLPAIEDELSRFGMDVKRLRNAPVIKISARNNLDRAIEELMFEEGEETELNQALEEVRGAGSIIDASQATIGATRRIMRRLSDIEGIVDINFITTNADFGPENLRLSPTEMDTLEPEEAEEQGSTLQDVVEALGAPDVWEVTRGENAIVAIFDTGYAEDLVDSSRVIRTFHGDDVDSVYAPEEGHGTMCLGASAANSDEGVPFDGMAPEADVILVRTTDSEGQINNSIIADAWDWITSADFNRPIVANHSYGIPLCSGRPKQRFCNGPLIDVIDAANEDPMLTSVYAAGNEAMRCGHRLSGITSGITGTNSLGSVITVGALLTDGRDAQRYSSHGRGDCAPISDPKPNVSSRIPVNTYYGAEGGWEIKDMSTGVIGSAGGTSHAAPLVTGMLALVQSAAMMGELPEQASEVAEEATDLVGRGEPMETEEIKQLMEDVSEPPRTTQVNAFSLVAGQKGYDARFGFGQFRPDRAILGDTNE